MINFYRYRLPGKSETVSGASRRLLSGLLPDEPGFLIAPFDQNKHQIFTIPKDDTVEPEEIRDNLCKLSHICDIPAESTSQEEHRRGVEKILAEIETGRLQKGVLARVICRHAESLSANELFERLCEAYPEAFVFLFHTAQTGTWVGASPETLLQRDPRLSTMALAGTRPALAGDAPWDEKNRREQQLVVDFIADKMRECGYEPRIGERRTRLAGPVEHLMTPIEAESRGLQEDLRLALRLSPTPALAGLPRDAAMQTIADVETFDRSYYGGFCGPMDHEGNFRLFVNLRSMQICGDRYAIYAGGGIVAGSDPDAEWTETENKAKTIINIIDKL